MACVCDMAHEQRATLCGATTGGLLCGALSAEVGRESKDAQRLEFGIAISLRSNGFAVQDFTTCT